MPRLRALVLVALALAMLLPPPVVEACGGAAAEVAANVPCGYIYPRLVFDLGPRGQALTLTSHGPLALKGTITFTWDISAEGLAAPNPTTPIVVTFSFPRKPAWLQLEVAPDHITVPIAPQYVQANQTAAGAQMTYVYTAPITVNARLNATPVLGPDEVPSMLLLAQSTESGLYKPGFGVRDAPLDLPEAVVETASGVRPLAQLRIGAPEAFTLAPLKLAFEGADLGLEASGPIELWKPAALTARVTKGGQPARSLELTASIVSEENEVLYTTGLHLASDGALPFRYTFPAPGQYRVLVAARPVDGASDLSFEPLVAQFDMTLPGLGFDALRYPVAYRAQYSEPISDLHANPADAPRQFEKAWRFPVLAGADTLSAQLQLGTTATAGAPLGSVYAEVLGPGGEQLAFGKVDPTNPLFDARLHGPLPPGTYRLHAYGTGLAPLGAGGSQLDADLGVFYQDGPVGLVQARGAPRPLVGGAVPLGTGGIDLDLVLHDEPALWQPLHAMLVAKDAAGQIALHPDFILTVRGPFSDAAAAKDYAPLGGSAVLYTTGLRHPHDGQLHWAFAFPEPGLYVVSAFAAPTPEVSGAFWEPAIASWPLRIAAPADGVVHYPATYAAEYMDSTSTLRTDGYGGGSPYEKRYPVPVLDGAQELKAHLGLETMAVVQHVEGEGPAALTLSVLDPAGKVLASAPVAAVGGVDVAAKLGAPGTYWVQVSGLGYAPIDYGGAMYNLTFTATYTQPPIGHVAGGAPAPAPAPKATPGFEGVVAALFVAGCAARRPRSRRGRGNGGGDTPRGTRATSRFQER